MPFTMKSAARTGLLLNGASESRGRRFFPWRKWLLAKLEHAARAVLASGDARRDDFLSASVDMRDYEARLKRWDDGYIGRARWFSNHG
ncbi:MAG TPA: hypothetical protein VGD46_03800 [Rhizobacter sp.]